MEHRELRALIAGYALYALDEPDVRLVESHLADCAECRSELDDLQEVAGSLAFAAEPTMPPPRLRASILEAIGPPPQPEPVRGRSRLWAGLAAGFGVAVVALGALVLVLNSRLDHARSQRDAQAVVARLLGQPGSRVVSLEGQDHGAFVVDPHGNGVMVFSSLDRAPSGRTYEAWLIDSAGKRHRAGIFAGGGTTVVRLHGDAASSQIVAVTIEPAGGVDTSTNKPISAGSLT